MIWCLNFDDFQCNLEKDCETRKKHGCSNCEEVHDCLFCAKNGMCTEAVLLEN